MKNLEHYVNRSKHNATFIFVKDTKLREVLHNFSAYVFLIYYEEIKDNNYCDDSKEMKSHTIFVYIGSIIEAVIYYFVQEKLTDEKSKRKYLKYA